MKPSSRRAFTLLEIVVVLSLVAILLTMVYSSSTFSREGVSLRTTAEELVRVFSKAKQTASLSNRSQELRWFQWDEDDRARLALVQFAETTEGDWEQIEDPWMLPEQLTLFTESSSLFEALPESRSLPAPPDSIPKNARAVSWIIHPSGKSQFAAAARSESGEFRFALAPAFVSDKASESRQVVFFLDPANSAFRFVQP
ncbi:MAG: type II secretion system protein [Verrucomicrobiota bacterium]